jgi:type II secretory pathway pseudopilin PulG
MMIGIVVIAIVFILLLPVLGKMRARAQRVQCTANLKSLHVATQLYMQEHGMWPQIALDSSSDAPWKRFAREWIEALRPHGPTPKTWICPALQALAGNPDYTAPDSERVDYIGTPFDDKPTTPHTMGRAVPWFSEAEDVHGSGNLIVFADGSVTDLKKLAAESSPSPPPR